MDTLTAPRDTFQQSFPQRTLQGGDNPAALDGLLLGVFVMPPRKVSRQLLEVMYLG